MKKKIEFYGHIRIIISGMGKTSKMKTLFEYVNEYVLLFLESKNIDESVTESWNSEENQKNLSNTIKGQQKKEQQKEKKKAEKKKKHKDAPKKAKSSYICFCNEMRASVKEDYPELDNKQIISKLGELWQEISGDEKKVKKWNVLAEQDKKRYEDEYSKFIEENPDEVVVKKEKVSKPVSAYVLFSNEKRNSVKSDNPDFSPTQVLQELAKLWNALKEDGGEELEKYQKRAKEEKEKFADGGAKAAEKPKVEKTEKGKKNSKKKEEIVEEEEEVVEEKPTKKKVTKGKTKAKKE